jgi:transcriptional regulator with PAS, ATPase and Fis domain
VAKTDVNIMVVGESGTGKELVAKAIHLKSLRGDGPFIAINCAAVPKDLMESELFGHTKGAFTGATMERRGLIAASSGGTLLLDEITEMPTDLQAKLLRVIEERRYRRVGSDTVLEADFRLLSTTNRDPQRAVSDGSFRRDLFYRLSTVLIELPPLKARAEDISYLCDHFLKEFATKHNRPIMGFSDEAYHLMLSHPWPGNVRELQHAIERAVLCARGPRIEACDLGIKWTAALDAGLGSEPGLPANLTLEEMERLMIRRALAQTQGNKQEAAARLGISRTAFYNKLKKHGLESDPEKTTDHRLENRF